MFDIEKALAELNIENQHPSERLREKTRQLVVEEARKKQSAKRIGRLPWVVSAAMAAVAAFIILFSLPQAAAEVGYYTVDINPSISMQVNASETVISVSAENEDASALLRNHQLTGLQIEDALKDVVKAADALGYLKDDGHVLVAHFGGTTGLTQQQIERAVGESTERRVRVLLLQSSEEAYEQASAKHLRPGIELLKKQAADQGIKEQDVDAIIDKMCGNKKDDTAVSTQGASEKNGKADSQPSDTENNQGQGNGSSSHGVNAQSEADGNKGKDQNDKDKTEENGNASASQGKTDSSTQNVYTGGKKDSTNEETKNSDQSNNGKNNKDTEGENDDEKDHS